VAVVVEQLLVPEAQVVVVAEGAWPQQMVLLVRQTPAVAVEALTVP